MRDILSDLDLGEDKMSDPVRLVQAGLRKKLPKRFYKLATAVPGSQGGFVIVLDGKTVRTPARHELAVEQKLLAEAIAAEWNAQGEHIDPVTMPLTRMLNTALDGVSTAQEAVFEDLLCYRAAAPETLAAREAEVWDPYLDWAASQGALLIMAEGIVHVDQPAEAIRAIATLLRCHATPLQLTAIHAVTSLTGSLVLGLALAEGRAETSEIWQAAHVDEDFNIAQWGEDHEAAARRAKRKLEFDAAALVLASFRS